MTSGSGHESHVHRLARAVADGSSIDWLEVCDDAASDRERRLLDVLGMLSRIRQQTVETTAFDSVPARDAATPTPDDEAGERGVDALVLPDGTRVPAEWRTVRLLELVGEGAFGAVFRGLDRALNLEVALKIIHPRHRDQTERILGEGRQLARLRHPNIVRVYGIDEHDGLTALRMEFVHGLTLDEMIREHGPFGERDAVRIGIDVARALRALHREGIIHRDVKSQNVMLENDDRVVLMDLGAGVEISEGSASSRRLAGTPMFMAPELLRGEAPTPASDVYATGVLLFHLATGEYPLEAGTVEEIREAQDAWHVRRVGDVNPVISAACAEVIERAMARRPADRIGDAEDLARALSAIAATRHDDANVAVDVGEVHPNNLPDPPHALVGRTHRLPAALSLLDEHRLVTLTGSGGAGKTRLALEIGRALLARHADGVWLVELAPVTAPELIWPTLAETLGIDDRGAPDVESAVIDALADKRMLVILDNCEHLVVDVTRVAASLLRRTSVRLVATSREPLEVTGEAVYPVPNLAIPDASVTELDALRRIESVRLFVARATAVRVGFTLTERNAPAVATICRRLDGIPLALELAAARTRMLAVDDIAERLDERFRLLTSGRRDGLPHHQTLRAAFDWGYELLPAGERRVFRRLSVFGGGWTLEAAEAVCVDPSSPDIVEALYRLITKSLVEVEADAAGHVPRYRMLETVREYAHQRLVEEGEERSAARAHRAYFSALAAEGRTKLRGPDQSTWLPRLSVERDNFLAALASYRGEDPDLIEGLRLLTSVGWLWQTRGFWRLTRRTGEELLAHPGAQDPTRERADVLALVGDMADHQGDYDTAVRCYEKSLEIRRHLGDSAAIAHALGGLGIVAFDRGEFEAARAHHEEALALLRESGHERGITKSLNNLAAVLECLGDYDGARTHLEEALARARESHDDWSVTAALNNLGTVSARAEDLERAAAYFREAVGLCRRMGERWGAAVALHNLAEMQLRRGEFEECRSLQQESLAIWFELEDRRGVASALIGCGIFAQALGDDHHAVLFGGCATAILDQLGVTLAPADRKPLDEMLGAARRRLGEERFELEWAAATRVPPSRVVERALAMTG